MNEIIEQLAKETGTCNCPICGIPFVKGRASQVLCGNPRCKKIYRNEYHKKYAQEHAQKMREQKRKSAQKQRAKDKAVVQKDEALKVQEDKYTNIDIFDKKIKELSEQGISYADYQKQKTLASVPKIKVEL